MPEQICSLLYPRAGISTIPRAKRRLGQCSPTFIYPFTLPSPCVGMWARIGVRRPHQLPTTAGGELHGTLRPKWGGKGENSKHRLQVPCMVLGTSLHVPSMPILWAGITSSARSISRSRGLGAPSPAVVKFAAKEKPSNGLGLGLSKGLALLLAFSILKTVQGPITVRCGAE